MDMKPTFLFEVITIAACSACGAGGNNSNRSNDDIAPEPVAVVAQADSVVAAPYRIADDCAGPFHLGAAIPARAEGFVATEWHDPDGGTPEIPAYVYEIGNEGWVRITPQYDPATGRANDRIGEILVYSDLFRTDRGIGAMSSVEEFAAAYPDFRIRQADEEGVFVVETPRLRNVRFLLQGEHYIGPTPDETSNAPAEPKVSDFREGACFTAILIGL